METVDASRVDPATDELAAFIRAHRDGLADLWLDAIGREARAAQAQAWAAELYDALADAIRERAVTSNAAPVAERYALRRIAAGPPVGRLIRELAALREPVADAWRVEAGEDLPSAQLRVLDRALDLMAATAAERYVAERDRTLEALDRISSLAFESRRVHDLLQGLLQILVDASSAVESASILLREGDWLVVRAAAGLEEPLRGGAFRLRIGEGVAGRVAAERRPRLLGAEQIAAEAASPALRAKGLRTLYCVPLQSDRELLGVAEIGSSLVDTFSEHDLVRFQDMCARATAAIRSQMLQDALEARARELETVIESVPDAVLVADSEGVHHANRAALELLGADSIHQLNRETASLAEILNARRPGEDLPLPPAERFFPAALRGEAKTRDIVVRHLRSGRDVALRCSAAPVRTGNRIVGAVAICADVTERMREDADRDRLYREARQAAADRQHVLGFVSHDLRNALSTIVIAAETMKDPDLARDLGNRGLAAITRAASRMNRLISDLLDVHSVEAGRLSVNLAPTDPLPIVEEVVGVFAAQAAARGLELRTELPESPGLVRGDRHRLVQALANLVSNSLKATAEGSVTIRLVPGQGEMVFSVTDTGPGFPQVDQARIFEPYWRAEDAGYKGTGLGLAIVRGIVEGHGGRVWIERPTEGGASVLFGIPVA